mmetsp:Transcript_1889/g.2652  ORF Transcript_1889/g.2652 Transcript_1889/m.2652 type:complete len:253 (+) Transcript_1889:127-885(+)
MTNAKYVGVPLSTEKISCLLILNTSFLIVETVHDNTSRKVMIHHDTLFTVLWIGLSTVCGIHVDGAFLVSVQPSKQHTSLRSYCNGIVKDDSWIVISEIKGICSCQMFRWISNDFHTINVVSHWTSTRKGPLNTKEIQVDKSFKTPKVVKPFLDISQKVFIFFGNHHINLHLEALFLFDALMSFRKTALKVSKLIPIFHDEFKKIFNFWIGEKVWNNPYWRVTIQLDHFCSYWDHRTGEIDIIDRQLTTTCV